MASLNGNFTENRNTGEANDIIHQFQSIVNSLSNYAEPKIFSFIHLFNDSDTKVGEERQCDYRLQKAAHIELGQNPTRHSSLVAKWRPQGQARQEVLLFTLHLELPWTTIEDVCSRQTPATIFFLSFPPPNFSKDCRLG